MHFVVSPIFNHRVHVCHNRHKKWPKTEFFINTHNVEDILSSTKVAHLSELLHGWWQGYIQETL